MRPRLRVLGRGSTWDETYDGEDAYYYGVFGQSVIVTIAGRKWAVVR